MCKTLVAGFLTLFGQCISEKLLTHSIHRRKNDKFDLKSSEKKLKYGSPLTLKQWQNKP